VAKVDTQPESKVAKKIPAQLHRGIMLVDEKVAKKRLQEKVAKKILSTTAPRHNACGRKAHSKWSSRKNEKRKYESSTDCHDRRKFGAAVHTCQMKSH